MAEEQDNKVADLLQEMEAEMTERRAARHLKRIKRGRAVMFIIALLAMASIVREVDGYTQHASALSMSVARAVFYLVLFALSRKYIYISLLIAAVAYVFIGAYSIIEDLEMFKYAFNLEVGKIQQAAFSIAILVRLIIFYYLVIGAINARRFEALYAEEQ